MSTAPTRTTYTKRGRGKCPSCNEEYVSRYKPLKCTKCGFELGGSYVPTKKKAKKCFPDVVQITSSIYSVKASPKDDRCFVVKENGETICLTEECKLLRSTYASSGNVSDFKCKHVNLIDTVPTTLPTATHHLSEECISQYSGGETAQKHLRGLLPLLDGNSPAVAKVTDRSLAVFGAPSATNTIGYVHLHIESEEDRQFLCRSKNCRKYVSNSKQSRARVTCHHLHLLYCLLYKEAMTSKTSKTSKTSMDSTEETTTLSRQSTLDVAVMRSLPYDIPASLLHNISRKDAATISGNTGGWPDIYEPQFEICIKCQSPLSNARPHPGQRCDIKGYLITELNPFRRVSFMVKMCTNPSCKAMHQSNPVDIGLFNISDKVVVSLDIFLLFRELFKHGHPLTNVISSKMEVLKKKSLEENLPTDGELEYIQSLLYNGFYCFEAITVRDENAVICGICGFCPEVLLGDGNEKNCCRNDQINYTAQDVAAPTSPSDFFNSLKRRWIEKTVLTRSTDKFRVSVGEMPPFMAPALIGNILLNTEAEKRSVYLKENSQPDGINKSSP
ncbi:HMG domain-containing protein 3 [Exaiptasia diaphana]|nr:HMG domain-containing protein 3 [Exaiptasia diaphana]